MNASLTARPLLRNLASGLLGLVACCAPAHASPVTYVGTVMSDISFRGTRYHHADVTITFHGDSADIVPFQVTAPDGNIGSGLMIDKGTATLSFESQGRTHRATFAPGQLFVSTDSYNGGIGFGSYIGPNGLEPAYPLAYTLSTAIDLSFNNDLTTETSSTGHAWSCVGYPPRLGSGQCTAPDAFPLKTDKGDFVIYQPYLYLDGIDGGNTGTVRSDYRGSMNNGTFSILAH